MTMSDNSVDEVVDISEHIIALCRHTGQKPKSEVSEYVIISAKISLNYEVMGRHKRRSRL